MDDVFFLLPHKSGEWSEERMMTEKAFQMPIIVRSLHTEK